MADAVAEVVAEVVENMIKSIDKAPDVDGAPSEMVEAASTAERGPAACRRELERRTKAQWKNYEQAGSTTKKNYEQAGAPLAQDSTAKRSASEATLAAAQLLADEAAEVAAARRKAEKKREKRQRDKQRLAAAAVPAGARADTPAPPASPLQCTLVDAADAAEDMVAEAVSDWDLEVATEVIVDPVAELASQMVAEMLARVIETAPDAEDDGRGASAPETLEAAALANQAVGDALGALEKLKVGSAEMDAVTEVASELVASMFKRLVDAAPDGPASDAAGTPEAAAPAAAAPASAAAEVIEPLPAGWKHTKAPDGRTYYYHAKSKQTQWERPSELRSEMELLQEECGEIKRSVETTKARLAHKLYGRERAGRLRLEVRSEERKLAAKESRLAELSSKEAGSTTVDAPLAQDSTAKRSASEATLAAAQLLADEAAEVAAARRKAEKKREKRQRDKQRLAAAAVPAGARADTPAPPASPLQCTLVDAADAAEDMVAEAVSDWALEVATEVIVDPVAEVASQMVAEMLARVIETAPDAEDSDAAVESVDGSGAATAADANEEVVSALATLRAALDLINTTAAALSGCEVDLRREANELRKPVSASLRDKIAQTQQLVAKREYGRTQELARGGFGAALRCNYTSWIRDIRGMKRLLAENEEVIAKEDGWLECAAALAPHSPDAPPRSLEQAMKAAEEMLEQEAKEAAAARRKAEKARAKREKKRLAAERARAESSNEQPPPATPEKRGVTALEQWERELEEEERREAEAKARAESAAEEAQREREASAQREAEAKARAEATAEQARVKVEVARAADAQLEELLADTVSSIAAEVAAATMADLEAELEAEMEVEVVVAETLTSLAAEVLTGAILELVTEAVSDGRARKSHNMLGDVLLTSMRDMRREEGEPTPAEPQAEGMVDAQAARKARLGAARQAWLQHTRSREQDVSGAPRLLHAEEWPTPQQLAEGVLLPCSLTQPLAEQQTVNSSAPHLHAEEWPTPQQLTEQHAARREAEARARAESAEQARREAQLADEARAEAMATVWRRREAAAREQQARHALCVERMEAIVADVATEVAAEVVAAMIEQEARASECADALTDEVIARLAAEVAADAMDAATIAAAPPWPRRSYDSRKDCRTVLVAHGSRVRDTVGESIYQAHARAGSVRYDAVIEYRSIGFLIGKDGAEFEALQGDAGGRVFIICGEPPPRESKDYRLIVVIGAPDEVQCIMDNVDRRLAVIRHVDRARAPLPPPRTCSGWHAVKSITQVRAEAAAAMRRRHEAAAREQHALCVEQVKAIVADVATEMVAEVAVAMMDPEARARTEAAVEARREAEARARKEAEAAEVARREAEACARKKAEDAAALEQWERELEEEERREAEAKAAVAAAPAVRAAPPAAAPPTHNSWPTDFLAGRTFKEANALLALRQQGLLYEEAFARREAEARAGAERCEAMERKRAALEAAEIARKREVAARLEQGKQLSALVQQLQPRDDALRHALLLRIQSIIGASWPPRVDFHVGSAPVLNVFGSATTTLQGHGADLDIALILPFELLGEQQRSLISGLAEIFAHPMHQLSVTPIPRARVPIVTLVDKQTGTRADVSVGNTLALANTQLVRAYVAPPTGLLVARELCFLVKHWAKQRDICCTRRGTPSSYAWVLLSLATLQAELVSVDLHGGRGHGTLGRGQLLPCLQAHKLIGLRTNLTGQGMTHDGRRVSYEFATRWIVTPSGASWLAARGKRALAELLCSFFECASQVAAGDVVASVRNGFFMSRANKGWWVGPQHLFSIEDPIDNERDLGDVVNPASLLLLREEIDRAVRLMSRVKSGDTQAHEAIDELFLQRPPSPTPPRQPPSPPDPPRSPSRQTPSPRPSPTSQSSPTSQPASPVPWEEPSLLHFGATCGGRGGRCGRGGGAVGGGAGRGGGGRGRSSPTLSATTECMLRGATPGQVASPASPKRLQF